MVYGCLVPFAFLLIFTCVVKCTVELPSIQLQPLLRSRLWDFHLKTSTDVKLQFSRALFPPTCRWKLGFDGCGCAEDVLILISFVQEAWYPGTSSTEFPSYHGGLVGDGLRTFLSVLKYSAQELSPGGRWYRQ